MNSLKNYKELANNILISLQSIPKCIRPIINNGLCEDIVYLNDNYTLIIIAFSAGYTRLSWDSGKCSNGRNSIIWGFDINKDKYDNSAYKRHVYGSIIVNNNTEMIEGAELNLIITNYIQTLYTQPQRIIESDNIKLSQLFTDEGFYFLNCYTEDSNLWVSFLKNPQQIIESSYEKEISIFHQDAQYKFSRKNVSSIEHIKTVIHADIDEQKMIKNSIIYAKFGDKIADSITKGCNKIAEATEQLAEGEVLNSRSLDTIAAVTSGYNYFTALNIT